MDKMNFTIYENANGTSPFIKYLNGLNKKEKATVLSSINMLQKHGLEYGFSSSKVKYLESGIYELRVSMPNGISRAFFFHQVADNYVITNGYTKKTQKMDRSEFNKAKSYKKEMEG